MCGRYEIIYADEMIFALELRVVYILRQSHLRPEVRKKCVLFNEI